MKITMRIEDVGSKSEGLKKTKNSLLIVFRSSGIKGTLWFRNVKVEEINY